MEVKMASIVDSLMGMLSGEMLGKISEQVGIPEDKTKEVLPDVLAVLTGALAKNSLQEKGAQELASALSKDHDGSILDNISDFISDYKSGEGNGILKHVLGEKRNVVEQSLGEKDGLDASAISNLLTMAAPLIMGALGKTKRQGGLSARDLSDFLGMEQNETKKAAPGVMDILNSILNPESNQSASTPASGSTAKKRSPIVTIIVVAVIAVVAYLALRYFGIL
jgi:hypothetical protein